MEVWKEGGLLQNEEPEKIPLCIVGESSSARCGFLHVAPGSGCESGSGVVEGRKKLQNGGTEFLLLK